MTLNIPGLAADDVAKLLTDNVKRPDGKDATAFKSQAAALKTMRAGLIDVEARLAALEAQPAPRPFP